MSYGWLRNAHTHTHAPPATYSALNFVPTRTDCIDFDLPLGGLHKPLRWEPNQPLI